MNASLAAARATGRTALTELEAASLLEEYGLAVARARLARTLEDLEAVLQVVAPPWAIKIVSPDVPHKTDVGGVALNVRGSAQAREAFRELTQRVSAAKPDARLDGVLVQHQVEGAVAEMLLGVTRDEQFGPVVLAGLGGIFAEALDDVSLRLPPVERDEAHRALRELKGYRLLTGFRGRPAGDLDALAEMMVRLSRLALELETEVREVDLNPVLVLPAGRGAVAVDALVTLA